MAVTGMRAVLAARAAMEAAGFTRERSAKDPEGWIRAHYANSLGYGLRPVGDNKLEWNIQLDGAGHMRWREFEEEQGEDTVTLHEPVDPGRLHRPIRAVFEALGLEVAEVRTAGWQGMWDREVSYVVVTDHPGWLEAYDPDNRPRHDGRPVLTGFAMRHGSRGAPPLSGVLPGYEIGGEPHLTRESVEVLAKATQGSWGIAYALDADGRLVTSRDGRALTTQPAIAHVNHWGDAVALWPVSRANFEPRHLAKPAAPFLLDGEMRTEAPFALFDAQHGEAPWTEAPAATPAIR